MATTPITDMQARQIRGQRMHGVGYKSIALAVGLSRDVVRNYCRGHGLDGYADALAANEDAQAQSGCPNCGKSMEQPRTGRKRKYCCDSCRRAWWAKHPAAIQRRDGALYKLTCACCGNPFVAYGNQHRKYCGHPCFIASRFPKPELT